MAAQARVWSYQAGKHVIAFKPKFNQIVLTAMKSEDCVVKRDGFDLFRRGLGKIYKPKACGDNSNFKDDSEVIYVCVFDSASIMTKQQFEGYLALGQNETDTISSSLLAKFADLVPNTRAAIHEAYDERFERNEEVLASLLRTVLYLYDPETWPIPHSLPPICAYQFSKGVGFTTRARLKPSTLTRWNEALQRGPLPCNHNEPIIDSETTITSVGKSQIAAIETLPQAGSAANDLDVKGAE
jgi:hypothetical protein